MDMPKSCGKCGLRITDDFNFVYRCAVTWDCISAKDDYKSLEVRFKKCPLKESYNGNN